ncbi:MAG TPA: glycosyltransferase family 2 protein [Chryseolinea sp.]|nr:glycosyltransferase family 2 protein [Chryseolinea sp.]
MVSIVLVTYNRAKRLRLSIRDILKQTFRDFELIICDDCSPDDTEQVCREFEEMDSRIRYFRHSQNKQMPANLNFGIQQARYEYIAILHDGDRFRSDLIEQWYRGISEHDNVGVVFNTLADSDVDDRIVKINQQFDEGVVSKEDLLYNVFFRRPQFNSPIYGEAMVRKSIVEQCGYLKGEYSFYADVDLWMEILHNHDAYYCADALIKTPLKSFQPQEFEDDIVRFSIILLDMFRKHRLRAFRDRPAKRAVEMLHYYALAIFRMTYTLLLVTKNFSFDYFINSRRTLRSHVYLLPIWSVFLIAYPVLRPALRNLIPRKPAPRLDDERRKKSELMFQR